MNRETSTVLMLDSFIALRWKSYSYSYANPNGIIQKKKTKQKGVLHAPHYEDFKKYLFKSELIFSTNYSIQSTLHKIRVEKQNKLASNPFDDDRMYLKSIKSLPWDKHTQQDTCGYLYCMKFVMLYHKNFVMEKQMKKFIYLRGI